jgi:RNA polymerase sigma-70 factor (ECF subfamily)
MSVMDALEALYRDRLDEFVRVAAAIAGDRERALDIVHEAFARAVRNRRRFRGDGPLEAWVWRIVVNVARDATRRTRTTSALGEIPVHDATQPALPLHLLTDRQREILFLHYYADLDYESIAAALEVSPGTVGATLSVARRTLRRALAKEVAS